MIFVHSGNKKKTPKSYDLNFILQTRKRHLKKFYEGVQDVMICTDIASRGLDTQCVN